jgi:hypothetical protein
MQKFDYRSPRFAVDLPVQFASQEVSFAGRCRDISREGMLLELPEPVMPNACGVVSVFDSRHGLLELQVRVAHSEATLGGMKFVYRTDFERDAVAQLVASLATSQKRPTLTLVD